MLMNVRNYKSNICTIPVSVSVKNKLSIYKMSFQNLKWREDNKMDTIHTEDWSDMEAEYPYHIEGFDKQGQPGMFKPYINTYITHIYLFHVKSLPW